MKLLDGLRISNEICSELSSQIAMAKPCHDQSPGLAVVLVGDDAASKIYVRRKVEKARELGIHSIRHELPKDTTEQEILNTIVALNGDSSVHGILVQSPLPSHIDEQKIIECILPEKDVDCFHPYNVGKLFTGDMSGLLPCTPAGIMVLLHRYGITPEGKHAVIIGRSTIVGKPMMVLLSQKHSLGNATVTLCHSRTKNISSIVRTADIVVAAVGKAEFITGDMVKEGATVIDVGINRVTDSTLKKGYRLVGDVHFQEVSKKAAFITPVPGGIGPMTIAFLMYNTIKSFYSQNHLSWSYSPMKIA